MNRRTLPARWDQKRVEAEREARLVEQPNGDWIDPDETAGEREVARMNLGRDAVWSVFDTIHQAEPPSFHSEVR